MRRSALSSAFVAAGFLAFAVSAQAIPVIPGGAGFGMETAAGRGGAVYKVTNLNESGTGSLKACIDINAPRVCVFEVSGVIRLSQDLIVRNEFLTIAGQTAPSPGIMLRGAALRITTSNVLVQHIRIRVGDDVAGPAFENRDALKITGSDAKPVKNIVIDHCSFSWAMDETLSVWGPHDNVTLSNNIFAEPLNDSFHPSQTVPGALVPHGYGVILGSSPGSSITMVGNLFAHSVERNPLSRAAELVFVNNLIYDRGHMDVDLQSDGVTATKSTVIKNLFLRGPSYNRDTSPVYLRTSGGSLGLGRNSRVYESGNFMENYVREMVSLTGGNTIPGLLVTDTYPVWNGNLQNQVVSTLGNGVYNRVLGTAGARPADRDVVDKRIITEVRNRSGRIINCVVNDGSARCAKNGGGWPSMAQNRRTLTLPANPNTVTASGYTNLEIWLQQMDASLSGTVQGTSPAAAANVSVY